MRGLKWFVAGALAVPLFHQVVVAIMNAVGFIDRAPYSFAATKPFGVPEVISLSFWGGVWGVILLLVLGRLRGPKFWIVALVFGAIAPTLVAGFVVAPLKGMPAGGNPKMAIAGLLINGAWGLGTAALARIMEGWGATSRSSNA
jgi:hypothetical protein